MLVYRNTTRERPSRELARELADALSRSERETGDEAHVEALLRAGELECALADLDGTYDERAQAAARLTDAIAAGVVASRGNRQLAVPPIPTLPDQLQLGTPEGYAFYALDPRDYARLAAKLAVDTGTIGVIGIRGIGTSLSAVVAAALLQRGCRAGRITVRPGGHRWARELHLSDGDHAWLRSMRAVGARFVIADEGPGLSGSTFLSVAEALERTGVPATEITLLCSHATDPDRLAARGAPEAWRRYASCAPPPRAAPDAYHDLSAGAWRSRVLGDNPRGWPATWTQLERIKYLSDDGRWLDKFEGWPPYNQGALQRAATLATAGYGPQPVALGGGFVRYPWLDGRPATSHDLERGALEQLATYCAFRARAFGAKHADERVLTDMLRANVLEVTGTELADSVRLELKRPIVPDARMQPHEWRVDGNGRLYKLDGHADGDAHLLPGPTDVCWDLAGAIVEWDMSSAQQAAFVHAFEALGADRVGERLPNYLLAYTALRAGALAFALRSVQPPELARTQAARTRYMRKLERLLRNRGLVT